MGPSSACPTFPRRPEVGRDRAWSSSRSTRAGLCGSWGCPPRHGTWRESTPCQRVQAPDWPSRLLKHVHERRKARETGLIKRAARSRVETIEKMGENVTSNLLSVGLCNTWHTECFALAASLLNLVHCNTTANTCTPVDMYAATRINTHH